MSRIFNAVQHAETERSYYVSLSLGSRNGQEIKPLSPVAPIAFRSGTAAPAASAPWTGASPAPESWEEAMALAGKQLKECEQQIAGQSGDQAKRKERLGQLEEEKKHLLASQQQACEKIALLEKSRLAWARQLEALKECAALSQAYREMEKTLQANQRQISATQESQKQLADDLARYEQRQADLQKQAEQVRFRLANALAATGTTDTGLLPANSRKQPRSINE